MCPEMDLAPHFLIYLDGSFFCGFCFMELTFTEVVEAYFQCRRMKRKTIHAIDFEFYLEKNLYQLYLDIINGKYTIGPSIAFVVTQPKTREIWAATFRDRIVHHIIYNRLVPRFYPSFIRDSFACIPERGVLDGSNRLHAGMRSISKNWTRSAYYLQGDIRNFFVSIEKNVLFGLLQKKILEPWLLELTHQVLFHDPKAGCILKSAPEAFARVPRHKSLWHIDYNRGLPIGNLTSQFFANVYLNELDQFSKQSLKAKYYYRYVDDFVILHESSERLNEMFLEISDFCMDVLKIQVHPFKKRIAPLYMGIDFIGYVHKPFYRGLRKRTARKMVSLVHQWKKNPHALEDQALLKLRDSLNSYYGVCKWAMTYALRKKIGDDLNSFFIWPDKYYRKLILPKN